jgi:predicted HAD superfamily Cof-like phosphohydrolase
VYFYAHELEVCDKYPKCKQTIREQVAEFHAAMNQKDPTTPTIPPDERVRLRAALIAEEFFEVMQAMFALELTEDDLISGPRFEVAMAGVFKTIESAPVYIDMPELADGLADLDYVVSGTYLEFGINSGPVAAEVHRSNMMKFIGEPVWAPNGKRLKPAGWTPPDIEGELRKQGWKP